MNKATSEPNKISEEVHRNINDRVLCVCKAMVNHFRWCCYGGIKLHPLVVNKSTHGH